MCHFLSENSAFLHTLQHSQAPFRDFFQTESSFSRVLLRFAFKHPKLQASVNFSVSGCFPGPKKNFFRLCFKLRFPLSNLGGRLGKMIKRDFSTLEMSQFSSLIKTPKAFSHSTEAKSERTRPTKYEFMMRIEV